MDAGKIIADGEPQAVMADPQVITRLSRRRPEMSLLSVENLVVRHGLLQAVRGVSFSVERGETLALVGANGAGKTTLLRAIAGAHQPAAGRVLLDGADLTDVPSHKRVGMGIALVPEGRQLFVADDGRGEPSARQDRRPTGRLERRQGARDVPQPRSRAATPRPAISRAASSRRRRSAGR